MISRLYIRFSKNSPPNSYDLCLNYATVLKYMLNVNKCRHYWVLCQAYMCMRVCVCGTGDGGITA